MYRELYDDPRLSAQQAAATLHELIDLLHAHGGLDNKPLARVIVRLLPLFSAAARDGLEIHSLSD
ncbi:hypothetical protein [Lysobacter sp. CA199]|uniref:hypothetical protein n=1 Tax=Lysobacter sp. CA199 TaxID=3455608 RepID=UPI003F8D0CA0